MINVKKIVIFGGGSGLSQLLKGLKLFPLEITAVVSVSDNGQSTGKLRKALNIPAVGDITKVMLAMSNANQDIINLMNYRFTKPLALKNHSIKNLLLSALLEMHGSFNKSIPVFKKLLGLKGIVLPLTEDNVDLVGITYDNKKIYGEVAITSTASKIKRLEYNKKITVNPKVINAINEADLIIFSSGSLLTSIIPHLIDKDLVKIINAASADKMYVCNLFTQPGETDNFTVADHIDLLEEYLGKDSLDVVIANNTIMSSTLTKKYADKEQKDPVILDLNKFKNRLIKVISDNLFIIEDNAYRHDSLKTAYLIFSYLMGESK